jgi:hypothetical protein
LGNVLRAEQRDQRKNRNRRKILEQQDRKREAAVRTAQLLVLGENLQADGGRRERQSETDDQCALPGQSESKRDGAEQHCRQRHLRQPGAEDGLAHQPQSLWRQLQADDEQQQDHAELGQLCRRAHVRRQIQDMRADHRPGGKVAEHRAEAPAPRQRDGDDRGGQEHHGILQKMRCLHSHAPDLPLIIKDANHAGRLISVAEIMRG